RPEPTFRRSPIARSGRLRSIESPSRPSPVDEPAGGRSVPRLNDDAPSRIRDITILPGYQAPREFAVRRCRDGCEPPMVTEEMHQTLKILSADDADERIIEI